MKNKTRICTLCTFSFWNLDPSVTHENGNITQDLVNSYLDLDEMSKDHAVRDYEDKFLISYLEEVRNCEVHIHSFFRENVLMCGVDPKF